MLTDKLKAIKDDLLSFSLKEKCFILLSMIAVFCLCADYAIVRPVSNSLFIHAYGAQVFPYAWVALIPVNFLLVSFYNRFLSQLGVGRMFVSIALAIVTFNLFSAFFIKQIPGLPFLFYLWKDVYIMLMLQQIWSIISTTIDLKRAKYLYGIIYGVGGLGGVFGSLFAGFLAVKWGSESLLFLNLPLYAIMLTAFYAMLRFASSKLDVMQTKETPPFWEGAKLILKSRYLIFILSIVVFMQVASTLLDYQFQQYLEQAFPDKDLRTAFTGKVMGIVNTCTVLLQFVGSFLLIQLLGLRLSHFLIPLFLCFNAVVFLLFPLFGVVTFSFITIKSFDFSLFGVLRELLYVPLTVQEKFRAKSVIDVFAYRASKSVASLLIVSIQILAASIILPILSVCLVILFAGWCLMVTKNRFHLRTLYDENTR